MSAGPAPPSAVGAYLRTQPARPATRPQTRRRRSNSDDFRDFLDQLVRLAATPITVPLRFIHKTLTSPLTISVIIRLVLLGLLVLGSAIFSLVAVVAFWYSWRTGSAVEVEGWLVYGSKAHTTPHTLVPLPVDKFQEDLRYDVSVEMELVRPTRGAEEMSNFMLSLDLRAAADSAVTIYKASQPSLPPPPLTISSLPSLIPSLPCVIPYPFRFLCPSRILGYGSTRHSRHTARRSRSSPGRSLRLQDVVLMEKDLMEGVVLKPSGGPHVGSVFVSIGREDSFGDGSEACKQSKEIRTTGWVIVRFTPRPTGIRWILASHPLPPLLILPPISLALTISSAILAFLIISCVFRPKSASKQRGEQRSSTDVGRNSTEEGITQVITERNREERREAERRRHQWDPSDDAVRTTTPIQREGRASDNLASAGGSPAVATGATPGWSSDDRSDTSAMSATETTGEESESTVHAFSDTASESGQS